MLYQVKQKPEDFQVEEVLNEGNIVGYGDFLYFFFEKREQTTMEVVDYLTQSFHIQREEIGIAGLKDKTGITRQRLSISQQTLNRIGGKDRFIQVLSQKVKILKQTFNTFPLKVASNIGNNFQIRLCAKQQISNEFKGQIEKNIQKINVKGFPNCFGMQRFGKGKKNFYEAKDRLESLAQKFRDEGKLENENLPYHLRFMLQAYASMYFNEYVLNRREKGLFLLGGDILVDRYYSNGVQTAVYDNQTYKIFDYQKMKKEKSDWKTFEPEYLSEGVDMDYNKRFPTGPMLGRNLLLALKDSKARVRDDQILLLANFDTAMSQVCRIYQLWGVRRVLFVKMKELEYSREGDDILLRFFLPTGSYATVLLAFLLEGIDYLTLKDNSLLIPRITC